MTDKYRIAILSDIHANFVALQSVMNELSQYDIDEILIAGDNIGLFIQPNEVVDCIRRLNARVICGNSVDYLRSYDNGTNSHWEHYYQMRPLVWTHKNLSDENKNYLLNLPSQLTFNIYNTSFRMVHGSVYDINELIHKHENDKIEKSLACAKEDILICGHSHQQWYQKVNGTLIINPGSVGLTFQKGGKATYSFLIYENGMWNVEQKCANYSVAEVKKAIKKKNINDYSAWEKMLLMSLSTGRIITLAFLGYAANLARESGWKDVGLIPNEYWLEAEKIFDWENGGYPNKYV